MRKTLNRFMIILMVLLGILILGMGTVKGAVSLSGNTSVKQGDTVKITVYYGEKVKTAQFIFQYDATKLTYGGVVGGRYNAATGRFSATSEETIDTLSSATFTFTAKETGSAVFNIANVKFASANKGKFDGVVPNPSISTTISPKTTPKPPVTDPEKPSGGNSGNNGGSTSKPNNNNSNTTTKNPTFTGGNATVYAKETVSIRKSWSATSDRLGTLEKGKSITRTGVGSNGWTRVSFNGRVAYISSQYLTTTKPKDNNKDDNKDDNKNNTTNNTTNDTSNNEANNNEINNTVNNTTNNEVNNTSNELVNNEHQGSNQVQNEKKDNKSYIEFIIIGVIILAILVIIISEISAKKRSKKKSKR